MQYLNAYQIAFIVSAFAFQVILLIHFSLRKWRFDTAIRYGPIIYFLGIAAAAVSLWLLLGGVAWSFWLAGFLWLLWGGVGYWIDYIRKIQWRVPLNWRVVGPYILLYLGTSMFYWFPLILIYRPLWYIYAVLFIVNTYLNVTSHKKPEVRQETP